MCSRNSGTQQGGGTSSTSRPFFIKTLSSACRNKNGRHKSHHPNHFSLSSSIDDDSNKPDEVFLNSNDMVLVNELTSKTSLTIQAAFYLPHLIFFLYKIGQSVFSPTTKLYLYASVCSDRYGDAAFQLVNNPHTGGYMPMTTTYSTTRQYSSSGKTLHSNKRPFFGNVSTAVALPPVLAASPISLARHLTSVDQTTLPHNFTTTCQDLSGAEEDIIQMEAADYIMAMKILQDVPAFVLGLFCGSWSDRVGRRLPMMLPCIGGLIVTLLFVFIQASGGIAIPGILFGVAVNSFTGRNTLVSMAVQAYITDQSSEQERTRQLGRILAMNFFGLFAGSFIMAILADRVSFWVVFLCVAFFYAVTLALIYFALPESKMPGQHTHGHIASGKVMSSTSSNSLHQQEEYGKPVEQPISELPLFRKLFTCFRLDNFTDTMQTIVRNRPNNMRRFLICAYLCVVLHNMCKSGEIDVLLLFVKHTPLNWTKSGYGYLLSFQYATVGLLLIFVLPFLLNNLHLSDSAIIVGCVVTKAFGLSLLAFSDRTWMVFLSNVFVSTFGMIISCLRSIITKMVEDDETGRCFAIITSSETVSDLIGVVFFTRLYYVGLSFPNGRSLPFVVMALIHIILLALAIYISYGINRISGEGALNTGNYSTLTEDNETAEASRPMMGNNGTLLITQNNPSSVSSAGEDETIDAKRLRASGGDTTSGSYGAFQQETQAVGWPGTSDNNVDNPANANDGSKPQQNFSSPFDNSNRNFY